MSPCYRYRSGLLAASLWSVLPAAVLAQEDAPIVVTATRLAQAADETLSSVTVITRADIERSQAASLPELLQGQAGINVASQGGVGKVSALFLRGTNSGHVTVLVDGIRMGSATAGTVAWEFLPLEQIERIEIARGPNSALYGSEAIGGVIQIFTRRGGGPLRWGASAGAGSYHTRNLALDASGGRDGNWFSARVARDFTHGFNATRTAVFNEPDKDGYGNTSASLRLGHRFHDGTELELHDLQASGTNEFDSYAPQYPDVEDFLQQSLGLTLRTTPTQESDLTVTAGRSLDRRKGFGGSDPAQDYIYNSERRVFSVQDDLYLTGVDTVSAGFDYHDDLVKSTLLYKETSRATSAAFVQYQRQLQHWSMLARLRRLRDGQFGNYTTGNLAAGYRFSPRLEATASYGTAFKAPTLNDLYYPDFGGLQTSNPDLQPEKSGSAELGLAGTQHALDWEVRVYRTRIDQLIVLDSTNNYIPANLSEARIDGVEASLAGRWLGWDSKLAATWLDAEDSRTGLALPRRARRTLRLDADRQVGRAGFGATLVAQSARFDDVNNRIRLAGYGVLNLRASWQLDRKLLLQGRLDNALDQRYQLVDTYNTAGRSLFVTLRYVSGT